MAPPQKAAKSRYREEGEQRGRGGGEGRKWGGRGREEGRGWWGEEVDLEVRSSSVGCCNGLVERTAAVIAR